MRQTWLIRNMIHSYH